MKEHHINLSLPFIFYNKKVQLILEYIRVCDIPFNLVSQSIVWKIFDMHGIKLATGKWTKMVSWKHLTLNGQSLIWNDTTSYNVNVRSLFLLFYTKKIFIAFFHLLLFAHSIIIFLKEMHCTYNCYNAIFETKLC